MRAALLALGVLGAACGQTLYVEKLAAPDGGSALEPTDMVRVEGPGAAYYIDRYEASLQLGAGTLGDEDQDQDDDGRWADAEAAARHGVLADDDEPQVALTTIAAVSVLGQAPAELSYYQAAAACTRAGKRLCRQLEWQTGCQNGLRGDRYPYGDRFDGADQGGADCWTQGLSGVVQGTGTATACVSAAGVYDLSGNVEEWVEYQDPNTAIARGGAHLSTGDNASCGSSTSHDPGAKYLRTGFRCCRDP